MDNSDSRKRNRAGGRARDRQVAREQRRRDSAMAVPRSHPDPAGSDSDPASPGAVDTALPSSTLPASGYPAREPYPPRRAMIKRPLRDELQDAATYALREGWRRLRLGVRDGWWYVTHRPHVLQAIAAVAGFLFVLFIISHLLTGRIFPNVWVAGIPVGDLTVPEAEAAIQAAWAQDYRIALYVEGERRLEVAPPDLGLTIDAAAAAAAARTIGMAGIPFGYGIEPTVSLDYQTAQSYLLELSLDINTLPYNAGYELREGQVVGIEGRDGRELDITATMEFLQEQVQWVVDSRRLEVLTLPVPPTVRDPSPFIADIQELVSQPVALIGYDPFTDTTVTWSTTPQQVLSWIETGTTRLTVRRSTIKNFVEELNRQVAQDDPTRYVNPDEAIEQIDKAVTQKNLTIYLRFNHTPETYTVKQGDTGFRISRKTGIPFFKIQEANPGIDWESTILYPGDVINLPSIDVTLPEPPVAIKRIIVDLDNQRLVAFENGQPVFEWLISSGVYDAPTSPGIYQIQGHSEIAYGSSFSLCDESLSCGQWKMYWFMGIYEVQPGLMNGFHGAVELPNGTYLGGGNVGEPYTFGCVMSRDDQAQQLYEWAEVGTVVEIVSSEYAPRSELGRRVYNNASPSDNSDV